MRPKGLSQSNDPIGNHTRDLPACNTVPQPTASPPIPLFYQNYKNYTKHVGNTREGQFLHKELRFESVNHIAVKGQVKVLYVRVKTYTTKAYLFIRVNLDRVTILNI
jgi:hypothetical protein